MTGQFFIVLVLSLCSICTVYGQQPEYLFVVTTDGFRWQELFQGADSTLIREDARHPEAYLRQYYHPSPTVRRQLLMPFFWSQLVHKGQVYGDRTVGNQMDVANTSKISYPGYSELFTGYCDNQRIRKNSKIQNPNRNILEAFHAAGLETAVFGSWNMFPYILNEARSGFTVNAGFEPLSGLSDSLLQAHLNQQMRHCRKPWKNNLRPDSLTWAMAQAYLDNAEPDVFYLALGETDEYGHEGDYGGYLDAAHYFDHILEEIWTYVAQSPKYAGKTAIVITTDHGRGERHWRHHHNMVKGSSEIWMAVAGAGIAPVGVVRSPMQLYQNQTARTLAMMMQFSYTNEHPVAPPIVQIFEPFTVPSPAPDIEAIPALNASTGTIAPPNK